MILSSSTAHMQFATKIDLSQFKPTRKRKTRSFNSAVHKSDAYTALLYANGSVVILGCKTEDDLAIAHLELAIKLNSVAVKYPKVTNQVYTGSFDRDIKLQESKETLIESEFNAIYEPELFPALVVTLKDFRGKLQVFRTGKYIITGVTRKDDAETLLNKAKGQLMCA